VAFHTKLDNIFQIISRLYRWFWGGIWAALILAAMVIALTVYQFAELLTSIHPDLLWAVFILIGILLCWVLLRCYHYARVPQVVKPPALPEPDKGWSPSQQRAYIVFACKWLQQQRSNPQLPQEARDKIPEALQAVRAPLAGKARTDPVRAALALSTRIEMTFSDVIRPLDELAQRQIQQAAVEVCIATALSPSALMDSLITMARNIELISGLATLYYGRPGFGGTVRIIRDVFGSAIVAGISQEVSSGLAGTLAEMTGTWTTKFLGPAGQGILNGLLLMRIGSATQQRCRSITTPGFSWTTWGATDYRHAAARLFNWISDAAGPSSSHSFSTLAAYVEKGKNTISQAVIKPDKTEIG